MCLFVVFCHHAHLDLEIRRYVRVHRDTEKTFIIVIFAKNASFRSYGVICLPQMHLNPKQRILKESAEGWKAIDSPKNTSFRSYGTFAYLLRAHIRNINMRRYITSACGHELSGRVRTQAYNFYAWTNALGLHSKLLITPLSE